MTNEDYRNPGLTPAEARRAREAAALRENLRRRKAQSRAREETVPPGEGEGPPEASGPVTSRTIVPGAG